jgi:hypothetical protein
MKRIVFLTLPLILFFVILPSFVCAQITFEKWYGGLYEDAGESVIQTEDSFYVVAGWTRYLSNYTDVYILKLKEDGDTLWTRIYGGSNYDFAYSVIQDTDGKYVLAGRTWSYGAGWFDAYLIKTYENGDTVWTKTYGGSGKDCAKAVCQTNDGGYILTGQYDYTDVYIVKTDSEGTLTWSTTYGGSETDAGNDVIQIEDSCYLILGNTYSFGTNPSTGNIYILKTKPNGDTLWTKVYGGSALDVGVSTCEASDGGYIIAGYTLSFGVGGADVYLLKIKANGDTSWTRTYGGTGNEYAYSVVSIGGNQGYVIAGWVDTSGTGADNDVLLIKVDQYGYEVCSRTYGGDQQDYGYSVFKAADNGFILTGKTASFGADSFDVYIIKTDTLETGVEEIGYITPITERQLQASPNPFIQYCSVTLHRGKILQIFDLSGRLIETTESNTIGKNLNPGIYFIKTRGYKPVKVIKLKR